MRRIMIISLILLLSRLPVSSQISTQRWSGSVNAEYSFGITGLNENYFVGIGTKPNYIFSANDFDGYFQPVYAEFKYQSNPNINKLFYYGVSRFGYSPISQKGIYAHLGVGLNYKKWDFGCGISYQSTKFKEDFYDEISYLKYNMVFANFSLGYIF